MRPKLVIILAYLLILVLGPWVEFARIEAAVAARCAAKPEALPLLFSHYFPPQP